MYILFLLVIGMIHTDRTFRPFCCNGTVLEASVVHLVCGHQKRTYSTWFVY
jgi:hypothetical protein